MAVIGQALETLSARERRWADRLSILDFDPGANLIDWPEAQSNPRLALRLRLALLRRKFDVVLSSALTDWPVLAPRLECAEERIIFWGSTEAIDQAREWLAGRRTPSAGVLAAIELGTLTYVREHHDGALILIADHLASTTSAVPSLAAGILSCEALFREGAVAMRTELRNRPANGRAPSGLAGHIGSVREIGTSFWGVVPWYVGWGHHEMLDYCDLPADPDHARGLIGETGTLFIADEQDHDYATALIALNLGERHRPLPHNPGPASATAPPPRFELHAPSPLLMPWQRLVLRPSATGEHATIAEALEAAAQMPCAITITAEIPLEDPAYLEAQHALADAGFLLSALAAPLSATHGRVGFVGLFSSVSSGLPVAAPYYLQSRLLGDPERKVVSHVARISQQWDTGADAAAA
jgi:hypothetical protein